MLSHAEVSCLPYTLQCLGVIETMFNQKYLEQHPEKNIKDIYLDSDCIKYRVIIMCPSHLVEKWEKSILDEVPYAKVKIINNGLKRLVELRKKGKEPTGKEYYIVSKDTAKLGYYYVPVPYQIKRKHAKIPICTKCRGEFPVDLNSKCKCGCHEWEFKETRETGEGLVCPECGELLLPVDGRLAIDEDDGTIRALQPEDFASQVTGNRFCRCCGTVLWMPSCEPLDDRIMFCKPKKKEGRWKKISHFVNRALKGRKSVWVMKSREHIYKRQNDIGEEEVEEMKVYGPRRFAPTRFIKKNLKGYFDVAVFDEVQEYKSGGSAQGLSMHDLINASDKKIALTGTIAGGYASDLFYTLYRLNPRRMVEMGYEYSSKGERRFTEKYGTVETLYEVVQGGAYNSMSRGRMLGSSKCLPGISPLIFTDFLLDTALFLDLSDLSNFLPKLYEDIIAVPLEDEIYMEYNRVRSVLKKNMLEETKGKLLLGSFLQFSLSYTDMPYCREPVLSPLTGEIIVEPGDLSHLIVDSALLNKEKEMVRIVKQELSENRCCFVYCEFTGSNNAVTYRLRDVLRQQCSLNANEVVVLESANPPAVKREAWLHERAREGTKIIITNAKCVATGLDFAFEHRGERYNYPTIIFYQLGYDMIKIWQGSRRHYRLNQWLECRTFYIVSDFTIQMDAIGLVASKEVATSSIQGQFSAEGIATMAKGVDARVQLAQAVAEKSDKKRSGLKKLLHTINTANNQGKGNVNYDRMPIFCELTGLQEVPDVNDPLREFERVTGRDILDLLGLSDDFTDTDEADIEVGFNQEEVLLLESDNAISVEDKITADSDELDILNLILN